MKKNIICSLLIGILFVLYFIDKGTLELFYDYSDTVKTITCCSLFLLPVIFCVFLYCGKAAVLYGILLSLTVFAVLFNQYMPFVFSSNYLPVLYLLMFFRIASQDKKNRINVEKDKIPLYIADIHMIVCFFLLFFFYKEGSVIHMVFGLILFVITIVFLVYRLMFLNNAETTRKNLESKVWFHYFASLALKILIMTCFFESTYMTLKASYVFYHFPFWLFMPDFLFLICMIPLSTEKKLNLKFITESMSEN